jgi:hypothetical protein
MRGAAFAWVGLWPLLAASLGEDDRLFHADADHLWNKAHRYFYLPAPSSTVGRFET